jgi:hypothetical protein
MSCSDSPVCCELNQKTVQDRRKDRGEDQSQNPDGLGVYLWRAGKYYEAGKSDNTRHSTHSKSNQHADNNLLHDIPFSSCDLRKAPTAPLISLVPISTFLQDETHLPAILFRASGSHFDSEEQADVAMTLQAPSPPTREQRPSPMSPGLLSKDSIRDSATNFCLTACAKSCTHAGGE